MEREHILTEEDFENNPDLKETDLVVGDTITYTDYSDIESVELVLDGQKIELKDCMTININGETKYMGSFLDWLEYGDNEEE